MKENMKYVYAIKYVYAKEFVKRYYYNYEKHKNVFDFLLLEKFYVINPYAKYN